MGSKGNHTGETLIVSIEQFNGIPCEQDCGSEALCSEHEGNTSFVSDESGSPSGSNNGCEEEKPNQVTAGASQDSILTVPRIGAKSNDLQKGMREDVQALAANPNKMPRKPDKLLPCPRCESLDTKFCYYNNYNMNQPRHFCKNCQRYWTAGGTLRNVPVGAGRRKNKHSASHRQRQLMPDMLTARGNSDDLTQQRIPCLLSIPGIMKGQLNLGHSQSRPHLRPLEVRPLASSSISVHNFGQESPLCENMTATSLNTDRNTAFLNQGSVKGSSVSPGEAVIRTASDSKSSIDHNAHVVGQSNTSFEEVASVEEQPTIESFCGSSSVSTQTVEKVTSVVEQKSSASHAVQANGARFSDFGPSQHGFNTAWNDSVVAASNSTLHCHTSANLSVSSAPSSSLAWNGAPSFWTGAPWPLMHTSMWGPPSEWPSSWSMPWGPAAAAAAAAAMAAATTAAVAFNGGLANTLRKHRLENSQPESGTEGCLWIPKTLRIDDPVEAGRSSIWTTLGLGDRPGSLSVADVTKGFHSKTETKKAHEPTAQTRHTNPAAMTRSMAFHENT